MDPCEWPGTWLIPIVNSFLAETKHNWPLLFFSIRNRAHSVRMVGQSALNFTCMDWAGNERIVCVRNRFNSRFPSDHRIWRKMNSPPVLARHFVDGFLSHSIARVRNKVPRRCAYSPLYGIVCQMKIAHLMAALLQLTYRVESKARTVSVAFRLNWIKLSRRVAVAEFWHCWMSLQCNEIRNASIAKQRRLTDMQMRSNVHPATRRFQ